MSKTLPWFKCFQDAWLDGTRGLTPEQRGLYFDCLCLIYKYDAPIRDDDKWISHQLHVEIRTWRAARRALIKAGKLTPTPNGLINSRAERECVERATHRSRKSVAASDRESERRQNPEFPFENNKTKPQLCFVNPVHEPQQGPHAHARSDQDLKNQKEDRSFIPVGNDDRKARPAQLPRFVSEAALDKVKSIPSAAGWDRQALLAKFLAWPGSKTAINMDESFLGWVRSFTKTRAAG